MEHKCINAGSRREFSLGTGDDLPPDMRKVACCSVTFRFRFLSTRGLPAALLILTSFFERTRIFVYQPHQKKPRKNDLQTANHTEITTSGVFVGVRFLELHNQHQFCSSGEIPLHTPKKGRSAREKKKHQAEGGGCGVGFSSSRVLCKGNDFEKLSPD